MKHDSILTKLIFGLFLLVIVCYIGFAGMKNLTSPYQFVPVYNDVVEEKLTVNSWVFRHEVRLPSAEGLISYRLDEGEKASAGQLAAISYQSQEALKVQQEIRDTLSETNQLIFATAPDSPNGKTLDTQILNSIINLQVSASRGDYSQLSTLAETQKELVLRREYLNSEATAAEMGLTTLSLQQALTRLQAANNQGAQNIMTPASGVFSSYVDGFETVFTPESLQDITPEKFKTLIASTPQPDDNSVGKLATRSEWYLAMLVSEGQISPFETQSSLLVRTASMAEAIPMTVEQIGYVQNGEAVVVLASKSNLSETINLREQSAEAIFRSEQGIRVPKQALRVQESTGESGVYAVIGYQAKFRPVKVVAEDQDDYIVQPNLSGVSDTRVLRSGDEVIVSSQELYDKKVVR